MTTATMTRFSVRCTRCKKMSMMEAAHHNDIHGATCPNCASVMSPRMQGVFNGVRFVFADARPVTHKKVAEPTKCGARCRGACGPNCDCECGGRFHGIDAARAS